MVPVFKLGFGMSAIASTGTSLFVIVPTSISGAITHLRNRTCIPLLGFTAGIGGALTSPVGVWLASMSPEWAIIVCAAIVIAYSAITMFTKAEKLRKKNRKKAEGKSTASNLASEVQVQSEERPEANAPDELASFMQKVSKRKLVIVGALIGLGAGVLSGYVGVGGGFIMVPLFMQLLGTPMKLTSGTSLIAVMILAASGTVAQAAMGNIDWFAGICMAIGCIPGAYIGSKLIKKVPELALRYVFSAFLLIAAGMLGVDQMGLL